MIEDQFAKFNRLIGGSVLGQADRKNIGPYPVMMEIESQVDQFFIRERRMEQYVNSCDHRIIYPVTSPLPRIREMDLEGALPYFVLVVVFLLSVGGWFWLFVVPVL